MNLKERLLTLLTFSFLTILGQTSLEEVMGMFREMWTWTEEITEPRGKE